MKKSWSNGEAKHIERLNELFFKDNNLMDCSEGYSVYDAENDDYIVEIKGRGFDSDCYFVKEGLILEKIKYDNLIKEAKNKGKKALYVNHFKDGKYFIWNISKIKKIEWFKKQMNRTTTIFKGKVEKDVSYLFEKDIINI